MSKEPVVIPIRGSAECTRFRGRRDVWDIINELHRRLPPDTAEHQLLHELADMLKGI